MTTTTDEQTTMKFALEANYSVWRDAVIELPAGKTWQNVKEHSVRWNNVYLTFDDGTQTVVEVEFDEPSHEVFKRPVDYAIYSADEDGLPIGEILAEKVAA
jgi:hypothetical protein